ncbi:hypothetical protein ACSX1A_04060 [Pontibacter sp. MBLB2868]|uniref:hypothetical protein n=1 Tax=Pontibacter sp. MBLB2868 TaxID=3451555 RepID=UPI003F751CD1
MNQSIDNQAFTIIQNALQTVQLAENQEESKSLLDELALKTNGLIALILSYTFLEGTADIKTDDEIVLWTLPDVSSDFCASLWNLPGGFYKTAASSQRGAIEMAVASLYFQVLQNEFSGDSDNLEFAQWDAGDIPTPDWKTMKPKLKESQHVGEFVAEYDYCPIQETHDYYNFLLSFTHSRSRSPEDGGATNTMNMKDQVGLHNGEDFRRICKTMDTAISTIAAIWTVVFPQIIGEYKNSSQNSPVCELDALYATDHAKRVLKFAKKKVFNESKAL